MTVISVITEYTATAVQRQATYEDLRKLSQGARVRATRVRAYGLTPGQHGMLQSFSAPREEFWRSMKGQWIGAFKGASEGDIIVNVDERASYFHAVAYINDKDQAFPRMMAALRTPSKERSFRTRTEVLAPVDPATGVTLSSDTLAKGYAGVTLPKYADLDVSWTDDALSLQWTTDMAITCECLLPRSRADRPSELEAQNREWPAYKEYLAGLETKRHLFRGQNKAWRLRTPFHRTGRAELNRFVSEDVQMLHKRLSAHTRHLFNLKNPDENGAFFNLVQHHGYPTPLLDWTYSPYVAAFFAYRGISGATGTYAGIDDKVRILVFDQEQWKADWPQIHQLVTSYPHLSVMEFIAIENQRMIPQQAASMLTNIDDIESYIRLLEEKRNKRYLSAIDVPIRDREQAMRDLGYMGITAGSLFPDLDGACEELRERNFCF